MKTELENVLKYDFYNEKMALYTDVVRDIMLHLAQFRGLDIIDEEEYNNKMNLFHKKFVDLISLNKEIHYKYENMMNQIFDLEFDLDDTRHVIENYMEEGKIKSFNKQMNKYERDVNAFIGNVISLVRSMSFKKLFVTDMLLVKHMEMEFVTLYERIEYIESIMGKFEDTLE